MKIKNIIQLFITGFIYVSCISANTFFISRLNYPLMFISSIFTNLALGYSVKILSFGDWYSRIIYGLGCAIGCVTGTFLATMLIK